jgi:hypothetical protein
MSRKIIFVDDHPELAGAVNEVVEGSIIFTTGTAIIITTRANWPKLRSWCETALRAGPDGAQHQIDGEPMQQLPPFTDR